MFCSKCQRPAHECECGDIEERLERLADSTDSLRILRCPVCEKPAAVCTCTGTREERAEQVYEVLKAAEESHGREAAIDVLCGALIGAQVKAYREAGYDDPAGEVLDQP